MSRQHLLFIILGVCVLNGIFSPYLTLAIPITAALLPELFPKTLEWVLFFSSIFVASATLFFSGVPAAVYERLVDRSPDSLAPMLIWLGLAIALTMPALTTLGWL
jgi:hypothetical protein